MFGGAVPKARGRRPGAARKRPQRPPLRQFGAISPRPTDVPEAAAGAAIARSPAAAGFAARRAGAQVVGRRRFSESIADYAYVPAELRRVGFCAAGLVVLLVALSFVIG